MARGTKEGSSGGVHLLSRRLTVKMELGQWGWLNVSSVPATELDRSYEGDRNVLKLVMVMVAQLCRFAKNH